MLMNLLVDRKVRWDLIIIYGFHVFQRILTTVKLAIVHCFNASYLLLYES